MIFKIVLIYQALGLDYLQSSCETYLEIKPGFVPVPQLEISKSFCTVYNYFKLDLFHKQFKFFEITTIAGHPKCTF